MKPASTKSWRDGDSCPICSRGTVVIKQNSCQCSTHPHPPCANCESSWHECDRCHAIEWSNDFPYGTPRNATHDLVDDFSQMMAHPPATPVQGGEYDVRAIIDYVDNLAQLVERYKRSLALLALDKELHTLTHDQIARLAAAAQSIRRDDYDD